MKKKTLAKDFDKEARTKAAQDAAMAEKKALSEKMAQENGRMKQVPRRAAAEKTVATAMLDDGKISYSDKYRVFLKAETGPDGQPRLAITPYSRYGAEKIVALKAGGHPWTVDGSTWSTRGADEQIKFGLTGAHAGSISYWDLDPAGQYAVGHVTPLMKPLAFKPVREGLKR